MYSCYVNILQRCDLSVSILKYSTVGWSYAEYFEDFASIFPMFCGLHLSWYSEGLYNPGYSAELNNPPYLQRLCNPEYSVGDITLDFLQSCIMLNAPQDCKLFKFYYVI